MVFTPQNSYTHLQFIGIQHFYDFALCDFHLISCAACDKRKKIFQILDHCTIFFMIAGTYTPMLLLCVKGITGWVMLGVVWAASVIGILLNAVDMKRYKKFSMACYICIGWSCVFIIKPLVQNLTILQLCLLVGGGVLYTIGAVIYAKGKNLPICIPYSTCLWSLPVLCSFCSLYRCGLNMIFFGESVSKQTLLYLKWKILSVPFVFGNNCRLF